MSIAVDKTRENFGMLAFVPLSTKHRHWQPFSNAEQRQQDAATERSSSLLVSVCDWNPDHET